MVAIPVLSIHYWDGAPSCCCHRHPGRWIMPAWCRRWMRGQVPTAERGQGSSSTCQPLLSPWVEGFWAPCGCPGETAITPSWVACCRRWTRGWAPAAEQTRGPLPVSHIDGGPLISAKASPSPPHFCCGLQVPMQLGRGAQPQDAKDPRRGLAAIFLHPNLFPLALPLKNIASFYSKASADIIPFCNHG